jgi:hypothetical protein
MTLGSVTLRSMAFRSKIAAVAIGLMILSTFCIAEARADLFLNFAERDAVWKKLGKRATRTSIPAGLHVGEPISPTMHVFSFTRDLLRSAPPLRSYSYTLLQGEVLIVDSKTKKIVAIVSE